MDDTALVNQKLELVLRKLDQIATHFKLEPIEDDHLSVKPRRGHSFMKNKRASISHDGAPGGLAKYAEMGSSFFKSTASVDDVTCLDNFAESAILRSTSKVSMGSSSGNCQQIRRGPSIRKPPPAISASKTTVPAALAASAPAPAPGLASSAPSLTVPEGESDSSDKSQFTSPKVSNAAPGIIKALKRYNTQQELKDHLNRYESQQSETETAASPQTLHSMQSDVFRPALGSLPNMVPQAEPAATEPSPQKGSSFHSPELRTSSNVAARHQDVSSFMTTFVILPDALPRLIWDICYTFITLIQCSLIIFFLASHKSFTADPHPGFVWGMFGTSIYFLLDMLLNFRTARLKEWELIGDQEDEVADLKVLYIRGWFFFDLVCWIPGEMIWYAVGKNVPFWACCCLHILRAGRIPSLFQQSSPLKQRPVPLKGLTFFFYVALTLHLVACLWMWINPQDPTREGLGDDVVTEYNIAFYWAVTTITTVGYGDIKPTSGEARIFTVFVMLIGVGGFAFVTGNISALLAHDDSFKEGIRKKKNALAAFMKHYDVPWDVQKEAFCIYQSVIERSLSSTETLELMPGWLRKKMQRYIKIKLISDIPIFSKVEDKDCLAAVAGSLRRYLVPPQTTIFKEDELGEEMFLLAHGVVEVHNETEFVANLKDGSWFGATALLGVCKRSATVVSITACELYALKREAFNRLTRKYPLLREAIAGNTLKGENDVKIRRTSTGTAAAVHGGVTTEKLLSRWGQLRVVSHLLGSSAVPTTEGEIGDAGSPPKHTIKRRASMMGDPGPHITSETDLSKGVVENVLNDLQTDGSSDENDSQDPKQGWDVNPASESKIGIADLSALAMISKPEGSDPETPNQPPTVGFTPPTPATSIRKQARSPPTPGASPGSPPPPHPPNPAAALAQLASEIMDEQLPIPPAPEAQPPRPVTWSGLGDNLRRTDDKGEPKIKTGLLAEHGMSLGSLGEDSSASDGDRGLGKYQEHDSLPPTPKGSSKNLKPS